MDIALACCDPLRALPEEPKRTDVDSMDPVDSATHVDCSVDGSLTPIDNSVSTATHENDSGNIAAIKLNGRLTHVNGSVTHVVRTATHADNTIDQVESSINVDATVDRVNRTATHVDSAVTDVDAMASKTSLDTLATGKLRIVRIVYKPE